MAVNSKQKGNSFERTIANTLSSRFRSHTGIEQAFRRNADSGSFWGGKNKDRKLTHDVDHAQYGDIICPIDFKFTVECKNYKTPPAFNSVISQSVADWDKWIKQASQDAEECNKDYLIIIKYNRTEIFCILNNKLKELVDNKQFGSYNSNVLISLENLLSLSDDFYF
jgi:hypothetical protein